jgi:hypothetical protein
MSVCLGLHLPRNIAHMLGNWLNRLDKDKRHHFGEGGCFMVASLENAATMLSLTNQILLNFAGYLEGSLFATVLDAAAA